MVELTGCVQILPVFISREQFKKVNKSKLILYLSCTTLNWFNPTVISFY